MSVVSVVSDSSPLVNLARIGRLDLLPGLFSHLVVPDAVWEEVVVRGEGRPGATEVGTAAWIERRTVTGRDFVALLGEDLGAGEAEAIGLALECRARLLLMDERLGRQRAERLGIRCLGLVGILVLAKQRGLLPTVRPSLDALRDLAGFRLSAELIQRVLRDKGES